MRDVWMAADSVVSPLGKTSAENFSQLVKGISGISMLEDPALSPTAIAAGQIADLETNEFTRFESLCLAATREITNRFALPADRTIFILSTTKGNISHLNDPEYPSSGLDLHATSELLARQLGFKKNVVVSNACISGVMALAVARRFLQNGKFDHALVVGADELSRFVVSGFQSLQALSPERCRPFDADRKGINLGEVGAAMLLSSKPEELTADPSILMLGSGLTNDANHISGPSRTGAELGQAIGAAMEGSNLTVRDIDFISAHGTATLYNDEMESKAFTIAGLQHTPLNSLKGYYGHTLGGAGIVETVMSVHSLLNNTLIPTLGYTKPGVSQPLNIIRQVKSTPLKTFLKTASGFGGCNAAIVLQKVK
jgi:3-oxoacyl-[acyl-carrier-protein] synthase I